MQIQRRLVRPADGDGGSVRCAVQDHVVSILPVPVVFYFNETLEDERLAASLCKALEQVPIFSGRLRRHEGTLHIDFGDRGVSYSTVQRSRTLQESLDDLNGAERALLVESLSPRRVLAKGDPLMTVRVSYFRNGGTSIGVCWHHPIGDMTTFMCFMKAWARAFNGERAQPPLVVLDRPQYLRDNLPDNGRELPALRCLGVPELLRYAWYMAREAKRKRYVHFYFGDEELAALRGELSRAAGERLSINDALCAHMFSVIADHDPTQRTRLLSIAVDFRKHGNLPPTVCGNMITALNVRCDPGRAPEDIAREIRRSLSQFAEQHLDYHATVRFAAKHGGVQNASRFLALALDPLNGNVAVTNWSKFGAYDLRFGSARTFYFASLWDLPFPWLASIVEGLDKRGAVYSIALPPQLAAVLRTNAATERIHRYRQREATRAESTYHLSWTG